MTYEELSARFSGAQRAVAKRRNKYLIWTDDIQKVFLNLASHCSGRAPEYVPGTIMFAMDDIDREIKAGTVVSLKSAIEKVVAALQEDQRGKAAERQVADLASRRTDEDIQFRKAFRQAVENPVRIRETPLFGRKK